MEGAQLVLLVTSASNRTIGLIYQTFTNKKQNSAFPFVALGLPWFSQWRPLRGFPRFPPVGPGRELNIFNRI
jgi:hypothetical protein